MHLFASYRFRPRLWPTVLTAVLIAALCALGLWQLERRDWKAKYLTAIADGMTAQPVDLPATINDPEAWRYRRVIVHGRLQHQSEFHLIRSREGDGPGYHILTPLKRAGASAVLINRGWVPMDRKEPGSRPRGQIEGYLGLAGIVRVPDEGGWLMPGNDPANNEWFTIDFEAMENWANIELAPVIVEAGRAANPGGWPAGGVTRLDIANNHLIYAIQWFALAFVVFVIYAIYHTDRQRPGH